MIFVGISFALVLTCILEALPALFFKPRFSRIMTGIVGNIVTNPLANLIIYLTGDYFSPLLIILEIMAVAVEAFIYRAILGDGLKKCFIYSFCVNAFSFIFGNVIIILMML